MRQGSRARANWIHSVWALTVDKEALDASDDDLAHQVPPHPLQSFLFLNALLAMGPSVVDYAANAMALRAASRNNLGLLPKRPRASGRFSGFSPVITPYITHAARYVPLFDGCDASAL